MTSRLGYRSEKILDTRFIAACTGDFRNIVQAALHTGARYSELTALRVSYFDKRNKTLHVATSKTGDRRDIVLTDAGASFIASICKGRAASDVMLLNHDRPWKRSEQTRPMLRAVKAAKLPAINFHALRHTWASLAIMNGVPPMIVAKNLGHRGTRMVEKHYGHLAHDYATDAIRAGAPNFEYSAPACAASLGAKTGADRPLGSGSSELRQFRSALAA